MRTLCHTENCQTLVTALAGFAHQCIYTIVVSGASDYELLEGKPPRDSDGGDRAAVPGTRAWRPLVLEPVPAGSLRRTRHGYRQFIPASVAAARHAPTRIALPADGVVRFEPPIALARSLRKAIDALRVVGPTDIPVFVLDPRHPGRQVFDATPFLRMRTIAAKRATRTLGWGDAQFLSGHALEYCQLTRDLRYERVKLQLRLAIIDGLNVALNRAAQALEWPVNGPIRLSVEGLPTESMLDTVSAKLLRGDGTFAEIVAPILGSAAPS